MTSGGSVKGGPLQAARDAARGRLLTLGAGLLAAGALVFTARNSTLSRRKFELTEQSQVTDRYNKAIEQLGSGALEVRIAAARRPGGRGRGGEGIGVLAAKRAFATGASAASCHRRRPRRALLCFCLPRGLRAVVMRSCSARVSG
jgi:hypothetical protein